MNVEEALLVVEKAIWAKAGRHLNDAEVTIFRGSWDGLTYNEMAEQSPYKATYLKGDAGHKFWKLLSDALGEPVGKSNFRAAVERARSRFLLETGSGGRSPFGAVLEGQEAKQSNSESGDAGEESQSQTLPSSRSENTEVEWSLVLSGTVKEVDKARAEAIVAHLRKILGDIEVTLERIEEGSVILVLKSSPEGFEQTKYLFTSGQLTELLGCLVLDVRIEAANTGTLVNLSQWLQNVFEEGWQSVEAILGTKSLQPVSRFSDDNSESVAIGAKLIDLGMQLPDARAVAMVVVLTREADDKMGIVLRVCSTKQQSYLPPGLQLIVLDESEATFAEEQARHGDNWLQHEFQGNPGERFSIKVVIGDVSFQEYFAI